VPLASVARGTVLFPDTATVLVPLVCTIRPEPLRPVTLPLMVKVVGPPDELLLLLELELELELLLELLLELELELLELELLELELLELELELLLELLVLVAVLSLLPPPQAASTKLVSNDRTMTRAFLSAGRRVSLIGMIE
jgi:hypothetical protein